MALAARYIESVVEGLDLCPYARPARLAGRVRVERVGTREGAVECAARVAVLARDAETEVILLVFDLDPGDPRHGLRACEAFLREFQSLCRADGGPAFYSVMFHPGIEDRVARTTPDSLVRVIRRAPVPMIQCLRASAIDAVRGRAQSGARERLAADAPSGRWAVSDPVLSRDIALANFARYGEGAGRRALEELLQGLRPQADGKSDA